MSYAEWAVRHPQAARELALELVEPFSGVGEESEGKSETWAQQRARFNIAQQGAMAWRNNVGATPAKCKSCGAPQQPVRYGLAPES